MSANPRQVQTSFAPSTCHVPGAQQLSWVPGLGVRASLQGKHSRRDSIRERGTPEFNGYPGPVTGSASTPGPWGQPTFGNCNITSREQNQLAHLSPLTFDAIIRAHLSPSEVTKEKPNWRKYFQAAVISIFGKGSEAINCQRTPEFMVTQEENGKYLPWECKRMSYLQGAWPAGRGWTGSSWDGFLFPNFPNPWLGKSGGGVPPQPQIRPRGKPRAAGGRRTELPASGQQTRFLCQQFVLFETSCQHLKIRTFYTNIQISSFL